jgi:membrane associated rhomboid family serine protease
MPKRMSKVAERSTANVLEVISESDNDDRNASCSGSEVLSSSSSSSDASSPGYDSFHPDEESSNDTGEDNQDEDRDEEQERLEYFLKCLNLGIVSENRTDGNHTAAPEEDGDSYEDPEGIQEQNPNSSSSAISSASLFNNLQVIRALRLSISCPGGLAEGLDPTIALYIRLFEFAQTQRHKLIRTYPYGIIGLFGNLSDIRSDLLWAQDAIHRRETNKPYVSWRDYYRKESRTLVYPYFTLFMIVFNFMMMIIAFDRNKWKIEPLDINPLFGPSPEVLLGLGALKGNLLIKNNEWWRLVTPMFLHAGIIHLVINLACINLLGRSIERSHGSLRTAALFVVSAIGGNMISALMQPGYVLVGASGGIFGLMGLCVADIILNWRLLFLIFDQRPEVLAGRLQTLHESNEDENTTKTKKCGYFPSNYSFCMRFLCGFLLFFDIFVNSLVGFTPLVDNYAHLGGLMYGFLLSLTSLKQLPLGFVDQAQQKAPALRICHRMRQIFLRFFGVCCASVLLMISLVLISQSDGLYSPCLACRYISCIPFPFWVSEEKRWWSCSICEEVHADVYKFTNDIYYSHLEMFCPQGYVKDVDIHDMRYQDIDAINDDLDVICQRECV